MDMTRRNFVKAGTAVAAASALAANSIALADEAAAEETAEEAPAEEPAAKEAPAASGVQDGKYVTSALGHENYIYMETTFRGGAIANCRCLRND